MQRIMSLEVIRNMPSSMLRDHIELKALELMDEYEEKNLENIGCFLLLNALEYNQFLMEEMEFAEVLLLGDETYLHGVRILSDGYGEDVYLAIEKIERGG